MEQGQLPRCVDINRRQLVMRTIDLEELIGSDHPARALWQLTGELDLQEFYAPIKSLASGPGRSCFDPRLLICIWLYGYSRGIGSARELARQVEIDPGLQWLTGLDTINYHTLSDFRVEHKQGLDELFTQVLGVLLQQDLITLDRVTQDGTKIKAQASLGSFRRGCADSGASGNSSPACRSNEQRARCRRGPKCQRDGTCCPRTRWQTRLRLAGDRKTPCV